MWVAFFPTSRKVWSVQKSGTEDVLGAWLFKDCMSFTRSIVPSPFTQVVELVQLSAGTLGRSREPRLSFKDVSYPRAILAGEGFHVRSDIFGVPSRDPFWALVQERVSPDDAASLQDTGYHEIQC